MWFFEDYSIFSKIFLKNFGKIALLGVAYSEGRNTTILKI